MRAVLGHGLSPRKPGSVSRFSPSPSVHPKGCTPVTKLGKKEILVHVVSVNRTHWRIGPERARRHPAPAVERYLHHHTGGYRLHRVIFSRPPDRRRGRAGAVGPVTNHGDGLSRVRE